MKRESSTSLAELDPRVDLGAELVVAARATIVTLVLTGLLYPLAMTGVAQALFADRANGSLVKSAAGEVIGSSLIGQGFTNPGYLQGRLSAAGANGYDATSSGGSNLGPTSSKLHDRVAAAVERLRSENPDAAAPLPAELVTTSASGLDPHLSPQAALWQAPRIAKARGVETARVEGLIRAHVKGRDLGFLGEPTVNVLKVNLALDRQFGAPSASPPPA